MGAKRELKHKGYCLPPAQAPHCADLAPACLIHSCRVNLLQTQPDLVHGSPDYTVQVRLQSGVLMEDSGGFFAVFLESVLTSCDAQEN